MKITKTNEIAFIRNLTKAYTEGIYADTPANRKLGRVGMSYKEWTQKQGQNTNKGNGGEDNNKNKITDFEIHYINESKEGQILKIYKKEENKNISFLIKDCEKEIIRANLIFE